MLSVLQHRLNLVALLACCVCFSACDELAPEASKDVEFSITEHEWFYQPQASPSITIPEIPYQEALSQSKSSPRSSLGHNMDYDLRQLEKDLPGYAGSYISGDSVVVLTKTGSVASSAFKSGGPDEIISRMRRTQEAPESFLISENKSRVYQRDVRFSFAELYDELGKVKEELFQSGEVVYLDINEVNNVIKIGVKSRKQVSRALRTTLRQLSRNSFKLVYTNIESLRARTDNVKEYSKTNPVYDLKGGSWLVDPGLQGGVRIASERGNGCSLGLPGFSYETGEIAFMTAGHCSRRAPDVSAQSNDYFYQSYGLPWKFAYELRKPTLLATGFNPNYTVESDIMILGKLNSYEYLVGSQVAGLIAWSSGICRPDINNCNADTNSSWGLGGAVLPWLFSGMTVRKTGQNSGTSIGQIVDTCVTHTLGTNWGPVRVDGCSYYVDASAANGDSGTGVFNANGQTMVDYDGYIRAQVAVVGILSAGVSAIPFQEGMFEGYIFDSYLVQDLFKYKFAPMTATQHFRLDQ